jgi:glycosyltransferase involved in cell wall biosynthesis
MAALPCDVSVTVPTRGRAEHIHECISSLLACTGVAFEVIVVDQSDDHLTEEALAPLRGDERLRYLRTDTRGVCAARNIGIRESLGSILVCTDDDCRATPGYLDQLSRAFERRPEAAVLCGRVLVRAELLGKDGYAVSYPAEIGEHSIESMRRGSFPLTANLAIQRSTIDRVGTFDEALGAGGPLRSGGEPDFLLRVLRAGLRIFDAPEAEVTHIGVRIGKAGPALMRKYLFGTGAAMAKHARLGDPWGYQLLKTYVRYFGGKAARNLLRGARPEGAGEAAALLAGAVSSLRFQVDAKTRLYQPRWTKR